MKIRRSSCPLPRVLSRARAIAVEARALGVAAAIMITSAASAQFTNGSFETGDFTGWVTEDVSGPFYPLTIASLGSDNSFGWPWASTPTDGTFCAYHGWDGAGPGTIRIAQDVFIDGTMLEFDYRAAWDKTFGATADREFRVNIEPSGGGANLQSDLILLAAADTTVMDTGDLAGVVDVSAFVGTTVRVSFDCGVPEVNTGPAAMQLDNVRLTGDPPPAFLGMSTEVIDLGVPAGAVTYRVYADFATPAILLAVTGDFAQPLSFTTDTVLLNGGGAFAGLKLEDFAAFPLSLLWDSWITIGSDEFAGNDTDYDPNFLDSNGATAVITGSSWSEDDGGWFDTDPGTPAIGTSILIAQFTVDSGGTIVLEGNVHFQGPNGGEIFDEPFTTEAAGACCFNDQSCVDLLTDDCLNAGGSPFESSCAAASCEIGPCLFGEFVKNYYCECAELPEIECFNEGGVFDGAGTVCSPGPVTYTDVAGTPIPDDDPVGISRIITPPSNNYLTLGDVNVELVVTHPNVGDLCVTLAHAGHVIQLIQRPGALGACFQGVDPNGCQSDDYDITLDSSSYNGGPVEDLCGADASSPTPTGSYLPVHALTQLNGASRNGDWTLTISDSAPGSVGTLVSWSLVLDDRYTLLPDGCCGFAPSAPGGPCEPDGSPCCLPSGNCVLVFEETGGASYCTDPPSQGGLGGKFLEGPFRSCYECYSCSMPDDCFFDAAAACVSAGGTSRLSLPEFPGVPTSYGACCFGSDDCCRRLTESNCATAGGVWLGLGTHCGEADGTSAAGACCLADECCLLLFEGECTAVGGEYQGASTDCATAVCIEVACPADVNLDGEVGFQDLLLLLNAWGPCPECAADINDDGEVGFQDLLLLLNGWGPCDG